MMKYSPGICGTLIAAVAAATSLNAVEPAAKPTQWAYIHTSQCFNAADDPAQREQDILALLDECSAAGLDAVAPYVGTTSGQAHYPSKLVSDHRWGDWDPIRVFVDGARQRGMEVHLCVPVLACGHHTPSGILRQHPEWGLPGEDGNPVGAISPGHPAARRWVVSRMQELVRRYSPDGLLLDYLRFPSQATELDTESAQRFEQWRLTAGSDSDKEDVQQFRELLLTELMQQISEGVRSIQPDLYLSIYSWGHHVASNHRVAQNWPLWAQRKYIDEVNVCGYWFPDTYPKRWGNSHLEAFETVITESQRLLKEAGADTRLTFALGVRTSHGQVRTVVDIASYLNTATRLQADGVNYFTWSYLQPFLPQLKSNGVLTAYASGQATADLTTRNIQRGRTQNSTANAAGALSAQPEQPGATVFVATHDSSLRAQQSADFTGDGTADQEQINAAIAALPPAGGTVLLAEGTYDIRHTPGTLGGVLIERSDVVLAGQGSSTQLILAPDQNTNVVRIIGSGIHHVTIRDLSVDANRERNADGKGDPNISHDRFEFCGIKGYCRDPRGPGAEDLSHITIRNCEVRNSHRLGIMLEGSHLQVLDNVLGNAGSDSVELLTGPGTIRGNYVEITGQTHVAIGSDRGHSIQMSDNTVHVRPDGRLDIGFRTWADSQRHVINGNVVIVDEGGHCGLAMDLRGQAQAVTGNTIESLNPDQPVGLRIGGGDTVLSGNVLRNVTVTVNDTYNDDRPIIIRDNILTDSVIDHQNGRLEP